MNRNSPPQRVVKDRGSRENGFLSASLLGSALVLIHAHPIVAGILPGLLTFKPHLAILIPVALIAGRCWRTLAAMVASVLTLIMVSGVLLGKASWLLFLKNIPYAMNLLTNGSLPLFKMPSAFASTLLAGGGVAAATIFQFTVALTAMSLMVWVWYRQAPTFY